MLSIYIYTICITYIYTICIIYIQYVYIYIHMYSICRETMRNPYAIYHKY